MGSMGTEGIGFVVAAYAATWIVVLGYLWRLRGALKRARDLYEQAGGRVDD